MSSSIIYKGRSIPLPSDCSMSCGNTCESVEKQSHDGSILPHAISVFKRENANTYSIAFTISHQEYSNVMSKVYQYESLVGKTIDLNYCNMPLVKCIISDISISYLMDGTLGIVGASVSLNLRENIIVQQTGKVEKLNVRLGV